MPNATSTNSKPISGHPLMGIRVPIPLRKKIERAAKTERRTVSGFARVFLELASEKVLADRKKPDYIRTTMTRGEAIERLQEEQTEKDFEEAHKIADEVICELLKSLGYGDVVAEYEKVPKRFA